ncbi:MAG: TolC family protein [Clostridia bacterium]|nr:TolC family protein [Clostridia bacterium]
MIKNIKSKILSFVMAICLLMTSTAALADDEISLTMSEAYTMAVESSKNLQASQINVDRTKNSMDSTMDKYQHDETTELGYMQSQHNYDNSKKTYSDAVLQMQSSVYGAYINVMLAEKKLELAKASEKLAYSNLNLASQKNLCGMLSQSDYDTQKNTYQTAQTAVDTAETNLEAAYLTFNSLVGLKPDDRPILTDEITFTEFKTDSIAADMDRAKDTSLTLWQTVDSIALIQEQMNDSQNIYDYDDLLYQKHATQIQVNAIETSVEDSVRSLYNTIKTDEQNYYSALEKLTSAQQDFTVGSINYKAGMCTQNTLDNLNYVQLSAEVAIYGTILNHALDVAKYQVLQGNQIF